MFKDTEVLIDINNHHNNNILHTEILPNINPIKEALVNIEIILLKKEVLLNEKDLIKVHHKNPILKYYIITFIYYDI